MEIISWMNRMKNEEIRMACIKWEEAGNYKGQEKKLVETLAVKEQPFC